MQMERLRGIFMLRRSSKPTQSKRRTNCFSKPVAKKVRAEDYMDA